MIIKYFKINLILILILNVNLIYSININNDIKLSYKNNNNNNNQNYPYYLLFKPYNNDYNCNEENSGGLGYIILGNKTCISNNDISITIQLQSNLQSAILCKYSNNDCKNLIACEKIQSEQQCLDPFTSSMFINSQPIPSSFTRMFVIDPINNSTYFNSSTSNFGYNYKQYSYLSSTSIECSIEKLQYMQFISNEFYSPNLKYPFLSETFKCNINNLPEMIIGEQQQQPNSSSSPTKTINLYQSCINSNIYNNEYNFEITC